MGRNAGREAPPPSPHGATALAEPSGDLMRATGLAGWALWGALVRYLHERGMLPEIGASRIFHEAAAELERMSEFERPERLMARALIDAQFYQWREATRGAAPAKRAPRPVKAKRRAAVRKAAAAGG